MGEITTGIDNRVPIMSHEFEEQMKEMSKSEDLYSIALFDILGFSDFVESNGNQAVSSLYQKLVELIDRLKSTPTGNNSTIAGSTAPVPVSADWKENMLLAHASGYINVGHFSDTFIIYVNYTLSQPSFLLRDTLYEPYPLRFDGMCYPAFYEMHHIYISFLHICMEFFCQAILAGIPLRGCVSTGLAIMDPYQSIYLGSPLVEAAKGETAQNSLGVAFGKSFSHSHPVYNNYFIPYLGHIKKWYNSITQL